MGQRNKQRQCSPFSWQNWQEGAERALWATEKKIISVVEQLLRLVLVHNVISTVSQEYVKQDFLFFLTSPPCQKES